LPRLKERERGVELSAGQIVKKSLVGVGLFVFGMLLVTAALQLVFLLANPL
jgi:hypothetical protein